MEMPKKTVLFVCIGNACRSQMAESFARAYGSDVLDAASAGLAPAVSIPEVTLRVMLEKNLRMEGQFPKPLDTWEGRTFDLAINLSGCPLPAGVAAETENWSIPDPIGKDEAFHRRTRDQVEALVMRLVIASRAGRSQGLPRPAPPPRPAAGETVTPPKGEPEPPPRRKFLR